MNLPILIVDDEVEMRIAMSETLKHCGYQVDMAHNANNALKRFKAGNYGMVVTDMTMPKRSGLDLLRDLKALRPEVPVLLVTAYGTIKTAVEAMKQGAFDYIEKPFKFDTFAFMVERGLEQARRDAQLAAQRTSGSIPPASEKRRGEASLGKASAAAELDATQAILSEDAQMKHLLGVARRVAASKATVLIESESGTGKELLARYLHAHSPRAQGPFVAINCAALPETLLESELFGHRKGAFTGATQDHKGRFEQAHGGTILLDEISEMAPVLQTKLLRVLQEHTVDRVGGKEPIPVDVRIIATTNRQLLPMIEKRQFREDLYFRLNVIPLSLPPLRERKGDIGMLTGHFIAKHAARNGCATAVLSAEAAEVLQQYNWRGNVRELENVIERALLLCQADLPQADLSQAGGASSGGAKAQGSPQDSLQILPPHLLMQQPSFAGVSRVASVPTDSGSTPSGSASGADPSDATPGAGSSSAASRQASSIDVGMSMREAEQTLIYQTLKAVGGNRTRAAQMLAISARTLRNKLQRYGSAQHVLKQAELPAVWDDQAASV